MDVALIWTNAVTDLFWSIREKNRCMDMYYARCTALEAFVTLALEEPFIFTEIVTKTDMRPFFAAFNKKAGFIGDTDWLQFVECFGSKIAKWMVANADRCGHPKEWPLDLHSG